MVGVGVNYICLSYQRARPSSLTSTASNFVDFLIPEIRSLMTSHSSIKTLAHAQSVAFFLAR